MTADKAFEEHVKKYPVMSKIVINGNLENMPINQSILIKIKKDDFESGYSFGYQAGQKTLSPEVRYALTDLCANAYTPSMVWYDGIICKICGKTSQLNTTRIHANLCSIDKIEKLLGEM